MFARPGRRWAAVAAAVVLPLAVTACAAEGDDPEADEEFTPSAPVSTAPAPTGSPLKIGLISQENETVAFPEGSKAARAAVEYLNTERGGIDGHLVELEVCTTGDTAESAVACANEFANAGDVPLVISNTYNSAAVNEVLKGRTAVLTFNVDIPDMTTPGIYTLDPGTLVPAGVLSEILVNEGSSKVAIMYTDSPEVEAAVLPLVETAAEAAGLEVVQSIPVASGADYAAPAAAIEADAIDGIMMLLVDSSQCDPMARAVTELGVDLPTASVDICSTPTVVSAGGVDGWQFAITNVGSLDPSAENEAALEFRRILETYSEGEADYGTVAGYTFGHVIAAADLYAQAGADDVTADKVNAVLEGGWSFDPAPFVPVACPGTEPFPGECATSMFWAEADGDALVLAEDEPVTVDLSAFADLAQ
jgi:branched-chain amino acid transport system substrate-binding protein